MSDRFRRAFAVAGGGSLAGLTLLHVLHLVAAAAAAGPVAYQFLCRIPH